jgi:hypothetical protein
VLLKFILKCYSLNLVSYVFVLQNFIFMTITKFGPLTCSVITTTRKFFTILASVLIFAHPMSSMQWVGTVMVFAGLGLDSVYGKDRPAKAVSANGKKDGVSNAKSVVFERVADCLQQPERKER